MAMVALLLAAVVKRTWATGSVRPRFKSQLRHSWLCGQVAQILSLG